MNQETSNNTPENNLHGIELLKTLSFCVFDLETTGGDTKNDKIIEVGLARIEKMQIVASKNYLIHPEIHIPDFIQKLTTIHPKDLEDAPTIDKVIDEIVAFMGDSVLVAHNASFDVPFFNSVLERLGRPALKNKSICTNLMTKYLMPNLLNSNLNYMCRIFDIPHKQAHRASDDAMATAKLLLRYLDIFGQKGIRKINQLYYPRNKYELDRCTYHRPEFQTAQIMQIIDSLRAPFLIAMKGQEGIILYALPCQNIREEKEHIKKYLEEIQWTAVTIRIYGHFFEALISFNEFCNKLDAPVRQDIIRFLAQTHLQDENHNDENADTTFLDSDFQPNGKAKGPGDFLIIKHLVPEQYVIFPLASLHSLSGLVFRYPAHQKKLIQYIKSKSMKMSTNRVRKIFFNPMLKSFLAAYVLEKAEKKNEMLFFKKSLPIKQKDAFFTDMQDFIEHNPHAYHFPREYL